MPSVPRQLCDFMQSHEDETPEILQGQRGGDKKLAYNFSMFLCLLLSVGTITSVFKDR